MAVVGLLGAFLVAVPFATSMFAKSAAVDRFTAAMAPELDQSRLDRSAADVATLQALSRQLQRKALPALAAAQDQAPDRYRRELVQRYPAFGLGVAQLDATLARLQLVIVRLTEQRADFAAASDLPTGFLPMRAVPVLFLGSGVGLLGLVAVAWRTAPARMPCAAVVAFGLVVVAVPLLWSIPAKTQAVDDLTAATRPLLSRAAVDDDRARLLTSRAMAVELRREVLPGLAEQLHVTRAQFQSLVADQYPAVAAGLEVLPRALARFQRLVDVADREVGDFRAADRLPTAGTPTTLLTWLLLVPAAGAATAGMLALGLGARRWPATRSVAVTE